MCNIYSLINGYKMCLYSICLRMISLRLLERSVSQNSFKNVGSIRSTCILFEALHKFYESMNNNI